MASKSSQFESDDHDQLLEDLRSDRQTMVGRLSGPRWFPPGFGIVAAAYVATAAIPSDPWRNAILIAAVAASLALLSAFRRTTGIKFSRVGARATLILLCATGLTLLMLSVSYGLAAGQLAWWITAPTIVTLMMVTWFVRMFVSAAGEHIAHGI